MRPTTTTRTTIGLAIACLLTVEAPAMAEALDMAALEALFIDVQTEIQAEDWETAAARASGYAETGDDFNAHIGLALADMLLPHQPLLPAAASLLERCLTANSLENLAMLGPENATPLKLAMDAGRAESALALVYLKSGRPAEADSAMGRALGHLSAPAEAQPVDWLRAGLVDAALGRSDRAWERVSKAILLDSSVEQQDPYYLEALTPLIEARARWGQSVASFLAGWRLRHAPAAPDLPLAGADGVEFSLSDRRGRALFINFFSPLCSTCQMEVPAVRDIWVASRDDDGVDVLFVLNNPSLAHRVPDLFERAGIEAPEVVTLTEGSAYDHIPGEPTVWIVDAAGLLRARHTGYRDGDEAIYARELADISVPSACDCQDK